MTPRTTHRTNKSKPVRGTEVRGRRNDKGVARYYLLYEYLSGALNDGTIPAGAALPSEPTLVSSYKLSRTTVRRALARLEGEGRIVRRRGSGTFARQNRTPPRLHLNLHDFFADAASLASKMASTILRFEFGPVPASLRELQPQLGQQSLIIQRVHRSHGSPYMLTTAYVPEQLGRKIRKSAVSRNSLLTVLEQLGPRITTTEYTASAIAADAVAAKRLDVPLGAPLLRTRAVLTIERDQLCAVIDSACRPDRFNVRAELERNGGRNSNSGWHLKRT